MARLTKAQLRVLGDIDDFGLNRHFDVWCGHYWKLGVEQIARRTAEVLMERGMIGLSNEARIYSGHRKASAFITPAGRALLSERAKGDGE